jgi:hypothetical protein
MDNEYDAFAQTPAEESAEDAPILLGEPPEEGDFILPPDSGPKYRSTVNDEADMHDALAPLVVLRRPMFEGKPLLKKR